MMVLASTMCLEGLAGSVDRQVRVPRLGQDGNRMHHAPWLRTSVLPARAPHDLSNPSQKLGSNLAFRDPPSTTLTTTTLKSPTRSALPPKNDIIALKPRLHQGAPCHSEIHGNGTKFPIPDQCKDTAGDGIGVARLGLRSWSGSKTWSGGGSGGQPMTSSPK